MKGKWYLVGRLLSGGGRVFASSLCPLLLSVPSLKMRIRARASKPGDKELAPLCTYSCSTCIQKELSLVSWPEQRSAPSLRSYLNSEKCISGAPDKDQNCSSQKRLPLFSWGFCLRLCSYKSLPVEWGWVRSMAKPLQNDLACGLMWWAADVWAVGGRLVLLGSLACFCCSFSPWLVMVSKFRNTQTCVPYEMFILKHQWYISMLLFLHQSGNRHKRNICSSGDYKIKSQRPFPSPTGS